MSDRANSHLLHNATKTTFFSCTSALGSPLALEIDAQAGLERLKARKHERNRALEPLSVLKYSTSLVSGPFA